MTRRSSGCQCVGRMYEEVEIRTELAATAAAYEAGNAGQRREVEARRLRIAAIVVG